CHSQNRPSETGRLARARSRQRRASASNPACWRYQRDLLPHRHCYRENCVDRSDKSLPFATRNGAASWVVLFLLSQVVSVVYHLPFHLSCLRAILFVKGHCSDMFSLRQTSAYPARLAPNLTRN